MNAIAQRTALAEAETRAALVGWIARAKALNRYNEGMPEIARALGAPESIVDGIKAASSRTLVPELSGSAAASAAFLSAAAEQSILLRILGDNAASRVPLRTRLVSMAADLTGFIVGEGKPIPMQGIDLKQDILEPFKVAALIAMTDELWRDTSSAGQTFLNARLREAVAKAADVEFFERVLTEDTLALSQAAYNLDGIREALRQMLDTVHQRPGARLYWALTPTAANALAVEFMDQGLNPLSGSMLGQPVVLTSGLPDRSVALLDARGIGGSVESLTIDTSHEATLEMANDPTQDATAPTATTLVSLFQTNSTAVRVVMSLGLAPLRDNVAAVLSLTEDS